MKIDETGSFGDKPNTLSLFHPGTDALAEIRDTTDIGATSITRDNRSREIGKTEALIDAREEVRLSFNYHGVFISSSRVCD